MPIDRFLHPRAGHSVKVTSLSDLEYRVWTQFLLSADDFGVMRASPSTLKADNDYFENRPVRLLQRCLDALVRVGLVSLFLHQGKPYLCQRDWQLWQKVEWPRRTGNPKPTDDVLETCDAATRYLFGRWPGGETRKKPKHIPSESQIHPEQIPSTSQVNPEEFPSIRAGARAERLMANGERLAANGLEGGLGETDFPGDRWWETLKTAYPQNRVTTGHMTNQAFIEALRAAKDGPHAAWRRMVDNLQNQKRGHEWRVKGLIPKLENWLRSGAWEQQHEEMPAAVLVTDKTAATLEAAAAVKRIGRP